MKKNISPARSAAYKILYDVLENGAFSNIAVNRHLNPHVKNENDRALATNIVYGTIKKRNRLTKILQQFVKSKFSDVDKRVQVILLMSVYQILYLDKIPEYALVNDAVNMTKLFVRKNLSSFVNGVLRNILRRKGELIDTEAEFYSYMYYEYGVTRDILDIYLKLYTKQELKELFRYFEEPPKLYIRINTKKTNCETLLSILKQEKINARRTKVKNALLLEQNRNIFSCQAYKQGLFFIEDLSGIISGEILSPKITDCVLDVCSAPGGKSFNAALYAEEGHVTSCDQSVNKLELLKRMALQLGLDNIRVLHRDATKMYESELERYDKVICDVPCSGLGVIQRKPEILMRINKEYIMQLCQKQQQILSIAAQYLKKGGLLVYSTCTVNPEENMKQVEKFIKNNPMYHLEKIESDIFSDHCECKKGYLFLNPVKDDCDAFFIAKIRKEGRRILS